MSKPTLHAWFPKIITHDYFPWANRYIAPLRTPIGWFAVAAVASGLTGAFVVPQGWVVCAIVLAVMVLGIAWPWLALRGVSAKIHFDRRRCHEHDEVTVILTVTNRWPWPVWGLLVERGFFRATDTRPESATTALSQVAGLSCSRFEFQFSPPRRGNYPLEVPVLVTGFPFGIWSTERTISVAGHLIVWPQTTRLQSLPMLYGDRLAATGSYVDRPGHDGDILAARPYVRGDSLRRIHWVHTARRDALIVCERQTASRRSIGVVLDTDAFRENEIALDWGIRVVASLCREFHNHACDLTCELGQERHLVLPSTASLHRVFDRLATFQPQPPTEGTARLQGIGVTDRLTMLVTSAARWQFLAANINRNRSQASVRAIVLDDAIDQQTELGEKAWIGLSLSNEPSRQFQRQWEKQCHEDWAV